MRVCVRTRLLQGELMSRALPDVKRNTRIGFKIFNRVARAANFLSNHHTLNQIKMRFPCCRWRVSFYKLMGRGRGI